jgi:hypothetical protein
MSACTFWIGALIVTNALGIVSTHLAWKHGVWDGAYNQFLPQVRKAMQEYRKP